MASKEENTNNVSTVQTQHIAEFNNVNWWNRRSKKTVFLAIIILLILVMFAILILGSNKQPNKTQQSAANIKLTTEQKYHSLANQGKYGQAEQVLEDELAKAKTKNEKVAVYFQQSAVALQFKKYTDAQNYANKAVKLDPSNSNSYVALAQVAAAQEDKNTARNYWQQAINHLDKSKPQYNLTLRQYKTNIQGLSKQ
jgi:tetratricopeptide (TPR) repeat protein